MVVADGFLLKDNLSEKEKKDVGKWLGGWAVPNLASAKGFKKDLEELGFLNIKSKDIRKNIMPSSIRMFLASIPAFPAGKLFEILGIRTKIQTGHIIAGFWQYKNLKDNLWTYKLFSAEKK